MASDEEPLAVLRRLDDRLVVINEQLTVATAKFALLRRVVVAVVVVTGAVTFLAVHNVNASQEHCRLANAPVSALRDIVVLAQSSSDRNPLPPDLTPDQRAFYEARRAEAQAIYRQAYAATRPLKCGFFDREADWPRTALVTLGVLGLVGLIAFAWARDGERFGALLKQSRQWRR